MPEQRFGGEWTERKLACLEKYLRPYVTIFGGNLKARYYSTTYVDAFAGTGYRCDPHGRQGGASPLFPELCESEVQGFLQGSVVKALELDPPFTRYLFIEQDPANLAALKETLARYPTRQTETISGDANVELRKWCDSVDWQVNRAVVFIDPYGMEVRWETVEHLAPAGGIDLWILFPVGAVTRLLRRSDLPPEAWERRLTDTFGTDGWRDVFYTTEVENTLLGQQERTWRSAGTDAIGRFYVERLSTVFAEVAQRPLWLRNSRNSPLYLLCFAASNRGKAARTAVKIAQDVIDGLAANVYPQQGSLRIP